MKKLLSLISLSFYLFAIPTMLHSMITSPIANYCLIPRTNIQHPKTDDLLQDLLVQRLSFSIFLLAIEEFEKQHFEKFDPVVGDNKCQTRASMMLDIAESFSRDPKFLTSNKLTILHKIELIDDILKPIQINRNKELSKLHVELQDSSIDAFYKKHDLDFMANASLRILGLCYTASLRDNDLIKLSNQALSASACKRMLISTKKELCSLSIAYELSLANSPKTQEEKEALRQIEVKNFSSMTAFFPSFKVVLSKMKKQGQSFVQKITYFCKCGGIQKESNLHFQLAKNNKFIEAKANNTNNLPVLVIKGYQFSGSFELLKNKLSVAPEIIGSIPADCQKPCSCVSPTTPDFKAQDIETIILANFAQHRQFTNGAEIDFKGLGLEDSELQKEYEYLRTIPGCSIDDMSRFCIKHIYVDTLERALTTIDFDLSKKSDSPEKLPERILSPSTPDLKKPPLSSPERSPVWLSSPEKSPDQSTPPLSPRKN